jgi:hypothetical protein
MGYSNHGGTISVYGLEHAEKMMVVIDISRNNERDRWIQELSS